MKKRTLTHLAFSAALTVLIPACAPIPQQTKVSDDLLQVHTDLQDAIVQVDVVDASIDSLITPSQEPLPSSFKRYSDHVGEMEKVGAKLEKHTNAMRSQGASYFSKWQADEGTVSSTEVLDISNSRQAEQRENFSNVAKNSNEVNRMLQTYLSDLRDIETYLSNDLTPAGVKAITPVAKQAKKDGAALQEAIKPMISALDRTESNMDTSTTN
ncbi:MAG: hypothetical protein LBV36_00405 [Chromatiales bacterium]|jgi:hypothetical protein|nr:hypothetical protein [Chromatiales bacterium]